MGWRCERCQHEWVPRDFDQEPSVCPKCKSPYWNRPRKGPLAYEDFRDSIQEVIKAHSGEITWTEIRTLAKLPQKFPNNQWVRQMEKDIGLTRKRDSNGIIHWGLS